MLEEPRVHHILLVEDNRADVFLLEEAFRVASSRIQLQSVENGEEALGYLHREGPHRAAPIPELILMDLNLPRMTGIELLATIRKDPALCHFPVLILSGSQDATEVTACYRAGASAFIPKPNDYSAVMELGRIIDLFWFHTALANLETQEQGDVLARALKHSRRDGAGDPRRGSGSRQG